MRIVILDSGVANVASVRGAFAALGACPVVTRDPAVARNATHLVLPGVGSFGTGMSALRSAGVDAVVRDAVGQGKPLLAICLGLQLLTEGSEESPGVPGLGLLSARCVRLPGSVRIPQLGWNAVVTASADTRLVDGYAAYANSFAVTSVPSGWTAAWTRHGVRFAAALERENILACQFHPELSGAWGLDLLRRWMDGSRPAAPTPRVTSGPARLTRRIVPCLDVADGRVVKGVRFQGLRDAGDPAERAALYEAQGADEIVMLDVTASPGGQPTRVDTVRRVRAAVHIPLTVGGGVRSAADAARLLAAGADKVSVNTAAATDPAFLSTLAEAFGRQCVVLAVDARRHDDGWGVLTHGGREDAGRDALAWLREGTARGAGEILLTSWDRDGTRSGADLRLLGAACSAVSVPVIASGGIGTRQDVADALDAGADAVLAASVFHDGDETVDGVKHWLAARGYEVRT